MSLITFPRCFAVNSAGIPYPNAKLYTYRATTTTSLTTYTTDGFITPHANPIVANSAGLFPAIYFDPSQGYNLHLVLKDKNDVTLWDEDNIPRGQTVFPSVSTGVISAVSITCSGFSRLNGGMSIESTAPLIELYETDAAVNNRFWKTNVSSNIFRIATRTDADAAGSDLLAALRSGTALTNIAIGNATDNPAITFNGVAFQSAGSFTGTLTGMTGSTTGSVGYRLSANVASLYVSTNILGTSNTTDLTMTGLPAALQPTGARSCPAILADNGGLGLGFAFVVASGTITFGFGVNGDVFTNAGSKGLPAGFTISYPL